MNGAVADHRAGEEHRMQDDTCIRDHWFTLPLDHDAPQNEQITVFAREYTASDGQDRPWLLYLQGGPGGKGPRQGPLSGWMGEAAQHFRILILDQRGTGLSTPVTGQTLAQRSSAAVDQSEYLRHFRAPDIVEDAEAIRRALGSAPWTTLGQSFGGFCTLTYLSFHPEGLRASLITGGLPPVTGPADQVYQATYRRMRERNKEYFARYPEDWPLWENVVQRATSGEEFLPDGSSVTVGRVQMLGMYLGGNMRIDQLHFVLQEAFVPGVQQRFSDTFLHTLYAQVSHAARPLYFVLHESIYAQPGAEPTAWAAQRILAEHPDFDPQQATAPLLTGEMVFDWYAALDPSLMPMRETAEIIANKTGWSSLYDLDQLRQNTVPVAAAVYSDDVYVDAELSVQTANEIPGLQVWQTDAHHHDALAADGEDIFKRLLAMVS